MQQKLKHQKNDSNLVVKTEVGRNNGEADIC